MFTAHTDDLFSALHIFSKIIQTKQIYKTQQKTDLQSLC